MDIVNDIIDKVQHQGESASDAAYLEFVQNNLTEMVESNTDIVGAVLTSSDGHAMAQHLPANFDPKRFAAMSSALQALSTTLVREAGKGGLRNVLLEGEEGNVYLLSVGAKQVLTVFTASKPNLGLTLAVARRFAQIVEKNTQ